MEQARRKIYFILCWHERQQEDKTMVFEKGRSCQGRWELTRDCDSMHWQDTESLWSEWLSWSTC